VDLNWYGIAMLRKLGLAWDVKAPSLAALQKKAAARAAMIHKPLSSVAGGDD
jgi:hypothetical protein